MSSGSVGLCSDGVDNSQGLALEVDIIEKSPLALHPTLKSIPESNICQADAVGEAEIIPFSPELCSEVGLI